jgi:FKBP-type peptidyl-prolyl cis-trans isomerase
MFRRSLLLALTLLLPLALHGQREKLPPDDLEWVEKNFPEAKKTSTGLRYVVIESGSGETAKRGQMVSMLYVGRLVNGTIFDQRGDPEKPLKFRLGRHQVIAGWDQIIPLMRPGDKWLVIIPPELAYGSRGQPPHIPRSATLVFMMELLAARDE